MIKINLYLAVFLVSLLFSCNSDDDLNSFSRSLNFTTAFTFESNSLHAPGMIGSVADNSIFIATKEIPNGGGGPERVLKYNLSNNTLTERNFDQSDLVSKQLHIVDDQLLVVGGSFVNTYDLNLSADPISVNHGRRLSRFGTAILDNDIYTIGGDVDDEESSGVLKMDLNTQTLEGFTILPEPRSGARGTIVNDYMYVFGGSETLFGTPANTGFKINMQNPFADIRILQLNQEVNFTFVEKVHDLIYVATQIEERDETRRVTSRGASINVFNTLENTYTELTTNLTNSSGLESIHQMCILNDKMYIIYGNEGTDKGGQFNEWEVLVSDLD